jgi:hypothetical protein
MNHVTRILSDIKRGDVSGDVHDAQLEVAVSRPARGLAHGRV